MPIATFIGIFLTGLLTGGVSCMAVQGGLLAATIGAMNPATGDDRPKTTRSMIIGGTSAFLLAKIISHTVFGALLGVVGAAFSVSIYVSSVMLTLASFFMIFSALNILDIHPFFRYFTIQPTRVLSRYIRTQSKTGTWFAPFLLGLLTIFIPCGTTQAMMVQAITSGSWLSGALTLFAFTLGTVPMFLGAGVLAGSLSGVAGFMKKGAALLVIGLAVWNLWNVAGIWGMTTQMEFRFKQLSCQFVFCNDTERVSSDKNSKKTPTTTPIITVTSTGYTVDNPYIPAGAKITLTVTNTTGNGCIQAFTIPSQGIEKIVSIGTQETFTFIAPKTPGVIPFSCSMGMYRGTLIVQ